MCPPDPDDIQRLLTGLSPEKARTILENLDGLVVSRPERVSAIRDSLVRITNRSRVQHARRLFTGSLEPLLVADKRAAALGWSAPGLVHRLDIGALWSVLAQDQPAAVLEAQRRLEQMAANAPLDEALASTEAVRLRDALCDLLITALDRALASRKDLSKMLDRIDAFRQKEARSRKLTPPPPKLDEQRLVFLRDVFGLRDLAAPLVEKALLAQARGRKLESMEEALRAFASFVAATGRAPALAALVPLTLLHARRDYGAVASFATLGLGTEATEATLGALELHLRVICAEMADELTGLSGNPGAGPLVFTQEQAEKAEATLGSFGKAMEAAEQLDILSHARLGAACRSHVSAMLKQVERICYQVLQDRIGVNVLGPRGAGDAERCVRLTETIRAWHSTLGDQVYWGSGYGRFKSDLGDLLKTAFRKALENNAHASAADSFARLGLVARLMGAVGESVSPWLDPPPPSFLRVARERLADPASLGMMEVQLLEPAVDAARRELARVRYWKDAVLLDFVEAASARLKGLPITGLQAG